MTAELLERAINYTVGSLHPVTPAALSRPTPCREWDLLALLAHMNDSLVALQQASEAGRIDLQSIDDDQGLGPDPVSTLRNRASRLLGAWTNAGGQRTIIIGGCSLLTDVVTGTGAVEIAVHGWDVAQACRVYRPIPPLLAEDLLALARTVVSDADRPYRFAAAVQVPPLATPGDRLVAFLGRHPEQ
jgi:uncharacterized protein (TIGR03086 family)